MSDIQTIQQIPDLIQINKSFTDLKSDLESKLRSVKVLPDLDKLLKSINKVLRSPDLSDNQASELRKIRQKGYDKKRIFKQTQIIENTTPDLEPEIQIETQIPDVTPDEIPDKSQIGFWKGVWNGMCSVDGERFIKSAPVFIMILTTTLAVIYLVWLQSLELYKSSEFQSPELAATGAMAMLVVFSAFHAKSKSWLSLFFCLYIAGYEVYFMAAGTIQDESKKSRIDLQKSEKYLLLKERIEHVKEQYKVHEDRYNNPNSKVFRNTWFKKTFMDKAWNKQVELQEELVALTADCSSETSSFIKISYRIGLIFLTSILVHFIFLYSYIKK